jgi:hypothetical protein
MAGLAASQLKDRERRGPGKLSVGINALPKFTCNVARFRFPTAGRCMRDKCQGDNKMAGPTIHADIELAAGDSWNISGTVLAAARSI